MKVNTMQEHLDWLAKNGRTGVVLGLTERVHHEGPLPRDGRRHLVAGTARMGGFRPIGDMPFGAVFISPNHRWLGVRDQTHLRLFDLQDKVSPGFVFFPRSLKWSPLSIHPSGEMVAQRTPEGICLLLPDGKTLIEASLPRRKNFRWGHSDEEMTFSSCGNYLWLAGQPEGADDALYLFEVPSLRALDQIPVPNDPGNEYDAHQPAEWCELHHAETNPHNELLMVNRASGDSFLGITFHRVGRGKIVTHPDRLFSKYSEHSGDRIFDGEAIQSLSFAPNGRSFVAGGRYNELFRWSWPNCNCEVSASSLNLRASLKGEPDYRHIDGIVHGGRIIFAELRSSVGKRQTGEVCLLGPDTLKPRCIPRPYHEGTLLPNGMVIDDRLNPMSVSVFAVQKGKVSVVLEMDGEAGCVREVYRRNESGWAEITYEVAWVEPNFEFEPEW
jgi:hypothetical protein